MVSSALALLIATPLGIAIAIFLTEDYLPLKIRAIFKFLVELLAAIPSVIYGLWGIYVVIPITTPLGNWWQCPHGLVSAFLDAFQRPRLFARRLCPRDHDPSDDRRAFRLRPQDDPAGAERGSVRTRSHALDVILQISLPIAASGIFGAAVLAMGRAMGETMALAMLVGNNNQISASIFAPANTIASLLANSFGEAVGLEVAALMYLSFILMALTLGVNAVAELILERTGATTRHF